MPEQGLYIFQTDATRGVGLNLKDISAKDGAFPVEFGQDSKTNQLAFTRRDDQGKVVGAWPVPESAKSTVVEKTRKDDKPVVAKTESKAETDAKIAKAFKDLDKLEIELRKTLVGPFTDAINFNGLYAATGRGPKDLPAAMVDSIRKFDRYTKEVEKVKSAFDKRSENKEHRPDAEVAAERAKALAGINQYMNDTITSVKIALNDPSLSKEQREKLNSNIDTKLLDKLAGASIPKMQTDINSAVALLPEKKDQTKIADANSGTNKPGTTQPDGADKSKVTDQRKPQDKPLVAEQEKLETVRKVLDESQAELEQARRALSILSGLANADPKKLYQKKHCRKFIALKKERQLLMPSVNLMMK